MDDREVDAVDEDGESKNEMHEQNESTKQKDELLLFKACSLCPGQSFPEPVDGKRPRGDFWYGVYVIVKFILMNKK